MLPPDASLVYLPYPYFGSGANYTPVAIAQHLAAAGLDTRLFVPSAAVAPPASLRAVTGLPMALPVRLRRGRLHRLAQWRIETKLLAEVRRRGPGTVVWLWPDARIEMVRALKEAGTIVIREMINTHRGTARRILEAEGQRIGVGHVHAISPESIEQECAELALCDHVVSPSEGVDASLAEWGVPPGKIIRSFFGWDPARFGRSPRRAATGGEPFTALFVGEVSVRKGAHLALAAWEKAGLPGELCFVGAIHPAMAPLMERHLAGGRVRHVPFTRDVAAHFQAADVLFFPTLEEGAPLVCYEAAGCGLPIITSPMGTARLVEDGRNGLVVDPHDEAALVEALRSLAADPARREAMSRAARSAAATRRWQDAAADRAAQLRGLLAPA